MPRRTVLVLVLLVLTAPTPAGDKEKLFIATPFAGGFTPGIEGPNCDRDGNVYVVNFQKEQTIGKVTPAGKAEVFVTLPGKSTGNGIVFDRQGFMYVADYVEHNILKIDMKTKAITVFAHEPKMNQPNDLAIAPDGTFYASDPDWKKGMGQVWRITRDGKVTLVAPNMGTTNGIDVSPDGKTLYVNESVQRNIWAFPIQADGMLGERKLLKKFDDHGFDGMRCDVDGNLYVTRYGKGTVAVVSPEGEVLREIDVLGKQPSNICFGGPDGKTVYVTEVEHTRLVQFRVDRPGLAWQRWQEKLGSAGAVTEPIKLFNGKDLTGFYTYLAKLGKNKDPENVFTVQNGAIRVSGKIFGCFVTEKEYENYHLVVEFKWGEETHAPRAKASRDSGILLHCVGEDGAAGGVWLESIECQMIEGGTGDFILVKGKNQPTMNATTEKRGNEWYYNPKADSRKFPPGRINWFARDPEWKDVKGFRGKHDLEKPVGEWNTLECICDGDKITNILNGTVVNAGTNASHTRGKILFQSEGAEVFFRKIELLPLKK